MICWRICILYERMSKRDGRTEAEARGQMLPGVAGICMFLIFMTMLNVYAGLHGAFGDGVSEVWRADALYAAGGGDLWVSAAEEVGLGAGDGWVSVVEPGGFVSSSRRLHVAFFLVRGLFSLVFFLYLVRTEVRERLR